MAGAVGGDRGEGWRLRCIADETYGSYSVYRAAFNLIGEVDAVPDEGLDAHRREQRRHRRRVPERINVPRDARCDLFFVCVVPSPSMRLCTEQVDELGLLRWCVNS